MVKICKECERTIMKLYELLESEMLYDGKVVPEKSLIATVKRHGTMIKYITNPTKRVQLAAVKENCNAIEYIENPVEEVQLLAVKENGHLIAHISNPSETVQLAAINQASNSIESIKNPTVTVLNTALTNTRWINMMPNQYDNFVKEYFKNNALLMNKWLRYAKNIREHL